MKYEIKGSGGGGKGGGGGRVAVEAPDSLRSKQYATVIDAISEGEIVGLVDGMKSIYLDETPLQAQDGTMNFKDVSYQESKGDPTALGKMGKPFYFPSDGVQATTAVGVEVKYDTPVVRRITSDEVDWVNVIVGIPGLTEQNKTNGDLNGAEVRIAIDLQSNDGGYMPQIFSKLWEQGGLTEVGHGHYRSNDANCASIRINCSKKFFDAETYDAKMQYRKVGEATWRTANTTRVEGEKKSRLNPFTPSGYIEMPTLELAQWEARLVDKNGNALPTMLGEFPNTYAVSFSAERLIGTDFDIISGKTTSRYQRTYRIPLTGQAPWDIRVRRITPDSTSTALQNKTYLDAIVEGTDVKLSYANTAAVMISIDSAQFNSIPRRAYDVMGLRVRVPSNYNPATREYTGNWDGTFKVEWTDNPAWCYYDLLTNERYGLGEFVRAENVDKWGLYQIAKYCDELVPDGKGGTEPRFSCNMYLQTREDAYKVITQMASVFRGMCYWSNDQIVAVQDAPSDAVALFTAANVIDGTFNYQSSDLRVRHTVAMVSWNDPEDFYKQKIEYVQDDEAVARLGVVQTEIYAVGCTSRGQAHRAGKWLLYTEQYETEVVSFKAGLDAARIAPGDVILTQDSIRSGKRMGGRITGMPSQSVVQIDSPVEISADQTYELSLMMEDGSIETRQLSPGSTSGTSFLIVASPFTKKPAAAAIWVLASTSLVPERWRVVSIREAEPTIVEISAVAHNPSKYSAVENGYELEQLPTSALSTTPAVPSDIGFVENHYPLTVGSPAFRLLMSWTGVASRFEVQWRRVGDNWVAAEAFSSSFTLDNVVAGEYEFKVRAVNSLGKKSAFVYATHTVLAQLPIPDSVPSASITLVGRDELVLEWAQVPNPYAVQYEVRTTDSGWGTDGFVFRGAASTCTVQPQPAGQVSTFYVRAIDYQGQYSETSATASFSATAPSATSVSGSFVATDVVLSWAEPASMFRVESYEVRQGNSWATGTTVGKIQGLQLTVPVTWLGSRTFWVAPTDVYGNTGPAASYVAVVEVPDQASAIAVLYDLAQTRLSWQNNPTSLPIAYNEVRRGASWESGTLVGKSFSNTLNLEVSWTSSATFWIKSVDVNGNESTIASYTTTITAPGAVSVASQFKDGNAILTWARPTGGSLAIKEYQVREGANWATGTVVGSTGDNSYSIPVNWTTSKTFWVAAVDTAGNIGTAGSRTVSYTSYSAVTGLNQSVSQATVTLSWQPAAGGSLPIKHYDIRHGGSWATGEVLARSNTTSITLPITWLGSRTLWVTPVDTNDQFGGSASVAVSVSAPSAPSVSSALVVAKLELSWTAPSASLPLQQYEIRHGASWAAGTLVTRTLSTSYRAPVDWVGNRTYWVAAIDVNGNVGTAGSTTATVSAPPAPTISSSFSLDQFTLKWAQPESSLPIDEFEVRYGDSWAGGISMGRVKGTVFSTKAQWVGARSWWVAAVDVNGNVGTPGTTNVTINAPTAPSITRQVIDNNVLLYWQQSTGTLPITTYEVRRGSSWATGALIGQKSGGFTTIFETAGGTYNYMIAAIDSAGNYGAHSTVSVTVSQPPDYILRADDNLDLNVGTKVNMQLTLEGGYMMPVSTTETFAQHFSTRSWNSPNDQVNAGFPIFAQPALSPGYYEQELDYGTVLSGTKISVTPTGEVVAGTPNISIDISTKAAAGDAWSVSSNTAEVYTNNFRYVKIRFTVSGTTKDLYRLFNINVKLDSKIRSDAGKVTLTAGGAHANGNIGPDYLTLWKAGSFPAGFILNGTTAENAIIDAAGPSGSNESIWVCKDVDTVSDAEGGWNTQYVPADCANTGHLFAVFMKTTTNNGTSYFGANQNNTLATLAGTADGNPYFWAGDLPALNTWYLVVGYVHKVGYGTVNTNISGVYDLSGNRVLSGTEYKALAGATSLMHRSYHFYNTTGSGQEVQYMARPVVIPCSEEEAQAKIQYLIQCATKPGAVAFFNVPFIDVAAVSVSAASTAPAIPVYDFLDVPNPTRFNVFNYDTNGVSVGGDVAWTVRGY